MNTTDLTEKTLHEIVARIAEIPPGFAADADFRNTLGIDSHRGLELTFEVERVFKITIPEERIPELSSLRRTVALVTSLTAGAR